MKITKDTQTVWKLETGSTIIGRYNFIYYVKITDGAIDRIIQYTQSEMMEIYGLTEDQFANIIKSGI